MRRIIRTQEWPIGTGRLDDLADEEFFQTLDDLDTAIAAQGATNE